MPYVVKHRRPPEPWAQFRTRVSRPYLRPVVWINWAGEWVAYVFGQWSIFEVLEYLGSLSVLFAVVFYVLGAGDRLKQKHYQAWQVINTAQGKGGSGGRIEAMQELNEDGVSLVGVDVSDAYLRGVRLARADLRRGDFRGADLRMASLARADLSEASMNSANLRGARLEWAELDGANFTDADLTGAVLRGADVAGAVLDRADLRNADAGGLRNWDKIKSIRGATIGGVGNPPHGFVQWAKANGATE